MAGIMNLDQMSYEERLLIGLEALLRRAALVNGPFALKGSLLTRQYLADRSVRDADDIDFLCLETIRDENEARRMFTEWMIEVTEMDLNDGVQIRSFRENAFWRCIDYAMADDFPTVNTDLAYRFYQTSTSESMYADEMYLDISFNLPLENEPVPLTYRPSVGEAFVVPHTVPLSTQVAWKLHQTIVRPRFKDLYDLTFLLAHPSYDEQALRGTLQTLVNECAMDPSITSEAIRKVLVDDLHDLYPQMERDYDLRDYAGERVPAVYFAEVAAGLRNMMNQRGFTEQAYEQRPGPTTNSSK